MKKLAFFGGSFDPIHKGHINICLSIIEKLHLDEVYIMPNGNPPHKSSLKLSFDERCSLIKLAIEPYSKIKLFDLEKDAKVHYTYNSLITINSLFTGCLIYFCMGLDSLLDLEKWYHGLELTNLCNLIVINRNGDSFDHASANIKDYLNKYLINYTDYKISDKHKIIMIKDCVDNVSSTQIRQQLHNFYQNHDPKAYEFLRSSLDSKVLNQISAHNYYDS